MASSTHSRGRRCLALTAAAGLLALTGPALPATAQPPDPGQPPESGQPPPQNDAFQPGSGPLGPVGPEYQQQNACMAPNPGGATIEERPWSQMVLGYERAHSEELTGQGRKIAVIDTGINPHRWLPPIEGGGSSVPDGGANFDCDGHGTIVAGILAAQPNDNSGFIGVAPDAQLMSLRQSSKLWQTQEDGRTIGNTQTMAQAVQHAVDEGANVINISQSSCQPIAQAANPGNQYNRALHTAVKNAHERGVVVVAAAGNVEGECQKNPSGDPTTAVLPAWFDDYVLTVASVNQQGAPSEFTVPGPWVDVAAPGEGLVSLDPGPGGSGLASQIATGQNGEMGPIQGTSFAAPYVSGLAALIQERGIEEGQQYSAQQVMERIKKTALSPGGTGGRNDIVGHGMIDPMAALHNVIPAEHGKPPADTGPARLDADVIPQKNWPAIMVALGTTGGGIAALLFTAFLINAIKRVRSRQG